MTKHSRVSGDFRGRAGVCLRAALSAGIMLGLMLLAQPALAAGHPVHYAEQREVVTHHVKTRRMPVQTESRPSKSSKSSRARAGAPKTTHAAKPPAKSSAKVRRHKRRSEDEADNDPLLVHRVSRRNRKSRREGLSNTVSASLRKNDSREIADKRPLTEETLATNSPLTKKTVTSDDFTRAAGGSADAPETFEHGQSHPDDDERLPVKHSQPIVAEVSAAPEPITPVGKATLPEKLHAAETAIKSDAAAAKNSLAGRGRAKPSVLPEDHDEKVAVIDQAMQPVILPTLYMRRGRLVMPQPLKGSREILIHQNVMADNEGLDRIRDDDDLDRMRDLHLLVPLNDSAALWVNDELPENRRYARPWASRFATDTARAFYARFHEPLHLNSAVRTVEYQLRLQRTNGNAAAVDGDAASPHLTGQALDFGKRGMSKTEIAWMRAYLGPLMRAGKIDVEEEFQQSCFHVSVYRSYTPLLKLSPKPATKVEVAREELPARDSLKPEPAER